jgi:hypothetical protein
MTTTKLFTLLLLVIGLTACSESNYTPENYKAFNSIEELSTQITESIKTGDEAAMLDLLKNEMLILDLLNNSKGKNAAKTKAYLTTKEGQRKFSVDQLSKKQRMNAFFTTVLPKQVKINKTAFKTTETKLISESDYSEGLPAKVQKYQLTFDNGEKKAYSYDIEVIFWNDKYHLTEAAGFLNS